MKVWTKLTDEALYEIARRLSVAISDQGSAYNVGSPIKRDGRAYSFNLRPTGERDEWGNYPYQRTSASAYHSTRRVHAVCWHGYRDFMRAVFEGDPAARIKTHTADYRGSEDFEDKFPDTYYKNVGSSMYPMYAGEVCTC